MEGLVVNGDAVRYLRGCLEQERQDGGTLGPSALFHLEVIVDEAVPVSCDLHGVIDCIATALLAPAQLESEVRERIDVRTGLYRDAGLLGRLEYAKRILGWLSELLIEVWDPTTSTSVLRSREGGHVFRVVRAPTRSSGEPPAVYRSRLWASLDDRVVTDPRPIR